MGRRLSGYTCHDTHSGAAANNKTFEQFLEPTPTLWVTKSKELDFKFKINAPPQIQSDRFYKEIKTIEQLAQLQSTPDMVFTRVLPVPWY